MGEERLMAKPTVLMDGLVFPESPRWHDGRLWFSDIHGQRVVSVSQDGEVKTVAEVPDRPSGLGFLPDGQLLVVTQANSVVLRLAPDGPVTYSDLTVAELKFPNDMVVDGHGRAYVGDSGFDITTERFVHGQIALVSNRTVATAAKEVALANGMVISSDGETLIEAETFGMRLTAFDIEADGSLSGRRMFADLREADGRTGVVPDGICLDAEGCVWVASPLGGELVRVREGGEITQRVSVRPRWAVACALGGADGRTLFLCEAKTTMKDFNEGRSEGFIETIRVDVPAAEPPGAI
jgi:sugar lactone lactonase YvrE